MERESDRVRGSSSVFFFLGGRGRVGTRTTDPKCLGPTRQDPQSPTTGIENLSPTVGVSDKEPTRTPDHVFRLSSLDRPVRTRSICGTGSSFGLSTKGLLLNGRLFPDLREGSGAPDVTLRQRPRPVSEVCAGTNGTHDIHSDVDGPTVRLTVVPDTTTSTLDVSRNRMRPGVIFARPNVS